jgi:hypothetical protein
MPSTVKISDDVATPSNFLPNDACVADAPSFQQTIDLIDGWVSIFPSDSGIVTGGFANLFADTRATWAIDKLGGVGGAAILELGPLEGAHTYMLDRAGAKSILAIEGTKRCFLKCLITKEVLGIPSANYLLGNFVPWLEADKRRFDVIWATGVLYHMTEPVRLLELLAERTDRIHIWTHFYVDDPALVEIQPRTHPRDVSWRGRTIRHFDRSYEGAEKTAAYCGGMFSGSSWLRRDDISRCSQSLGLEKLTSRSRTMNTRTVHPSRLSQNVNTRNPRHLLGPCSWLARPCADRHYCFRVKWRLTQNKHVIGGYIPWVRRRRVN